MWRCPWYLDSANAAPYRFVLACNRSFLRDPALVARYVKK